MALYDPFIPVTLKYGWDYENEPPKDGDLISLKVGLFESTYRVRISEVGAHLELVEFVDDETRLLTGGGK